MIYRLALAGLVAGLMLPCAHAQPASMSLAVYLARHKQIGVDYAEARSACSAGGSNVNAREVCLADAMGRDHVAKANLEVDYRSTSRTLLEANDARTTAAFWSARERCGDLVFRLQAACNQEAKAAEVAAKADARLRSRTAVK